MKFNFNFFKFDSFWFCFFLLFLLTFLATVVSSSFSLDSIGYQDFFSYYSQSSWSKIWTEIRGYELFFLVLAKIFNGWPSVLWFFVIAASSISLKLILMQKSSRHFYLSLFFYVSYFFILHDGTGIRVSLAIAIAFWGVFLLGKNRVAMAFLLIMSAAMFFHYSLFLFLIVFCFGNKKVSCFLIFLWPFTVLMWSFGFDLITLSREVFLQINYNWIGLNKLKSYALNYNENSAPYSMQFIIIYLVSVVVFLRYRDILTKFELICFNCVFASIAFLGVFVGAEGLQNRVSEIFRFGLVFIFPLYYFYFSDFIKRDIVMKMLTGLFLVGYFYYYVLRAGLIVLPESWGFII